MSSSAARPATALRAARPPRVRRFPRGRGSGRPLVATVPAAVVLTLCVSAVALGLAPTLLSQKSGLFTGKEAGLPWVGLLGWTVVNASNASSQASANPLSPSTVGSKSFNVNAPVNTSAHTYVELRVQVSANAPAAREFTLWVIVNGSASGTGSNIPGASAERFFVTPSSLTQAVTLHLFYQLGPASQVYVVTAVAEVSALCPSTGVCP